MVNLDNLVGLVSFVGILGFGVLTLKKKKNHGMCHDLKRKCKKKCLSKSGHEARIGGGNI